MSLTEKQRRENTERAERGTRFLQLANQHRYDMACPQDIITDILHTLALAENLRAERAVEYAGGLLRMAQNNFNAEVRGEE